MTQQDFEKQLKELDEHLHLVESPQAPDMCGVYYDDIFITGVPSGNIYEEVRKEYQNPFGTPHKDSVTAMAQIKFWLEDKEANIQLDKDLSE